MKIGFLGNAAKIHFYRWTRWLQDHGHEVVLFSDNAPPADWDYRGARILHPRWTLWRNVLVFKIKGGPLANNREKWRAYREIVYTEMPEILHAHEALAYGPTLAHFPDFPRVLTPWGPDIEILGTEGRGEEKGKLVRRACRVTDIITTNAPGLEQHWAALTREPEEKFHLFSWGVDRSMFFPRPLEEQQALRARLGLPSKAPLVLSPRMAKPYYRVDDIVCGWSRFRDGKGAEDNPPHLAVLRGGADDESWASIRALAREIPNVTMVDATLGQEDMAALYSTAEAMVMVPETDLLAASLLEGLACGCLPLLADLPCYRAAVADLEGDTSEARARGIYTREVSASGIAGMLERWEGLAAQERERLREGNIEYCVREQDWERCAGRMLDVYEAARAEFLTRALQ